VKKKVLLVGIIISLFLLIYLVMASTSWQTPSSIINYSGQNASNPASNSYDGNISSFWWEDESSDVDGDEGEWYITYDLNDTYNVSGVEIFADGDLGTPFWHGSPCNLIVAKVCNDENCSGESNLLSTNCTFSTSLEWQVCYLTGTDTIGRYVYLEGGVTDGTTCYGNYSGYMFNFREVKFQTNQSLNASRTDRLYPLTDVATINNYNLPPTNMASFNLSCSGITLATGAELYQSLLVYNDGLSRSYFCSEVDKEEYVNMTFNLTNILAIANITQMKGIFASTCDGLYLYNYSGDSFITLATSKTGNFYQGSINDSFSDFYNQTTNISNMFAGEDGILLMDYGVMNVSYNTYPYFNTFPTYTTNESLEPSNYFINLTEYLTHNRIHENITANITVQSNDTLINCTVFNVSSDWYMNCSGLSENQSGENLVSVRVEDPDLVMIDTAIINVTVLEMFAPTIYVQNTFVNNSIGHYFNVTAGVEDLDGDINFTNISTTLGTCVNIANSSGGDYFNSTWNCTGGGALNSTDIYIGFSDPLTHIVTTTSSNTFPNNNPSIPSLHFPPDPYVISTNYTFLNYSSTDADSDSITYYVYGDANANPTTLIYNGSDIFYNWTGLNDSVTYYWIINASDNYANVSSSIYSLYVSISAPAINIEHPLNDTWYSNTSQFINFTATDPNGVDTCQLWGNFSGVWALNQSINATSGVSTNFSLINFTDESEYIYNVWCNDTANEEGFYQNNFTFNVDSVDPVINLTQPSGTKTTRTSIESTWTVKDYSLSSCWYEIYRGVSLELTNTTVNCSLNTTTFNVTVDADFTLNFYVNDTSSNEIVNTTLFTVDTSSIGTSPGGGGASSPPITTNITEIKYADFCGDGICGTNETPTNCWQDCAINIDNIILCLFTDPKSCIYSDTWFATAMVYFLVAMGIWLVYKSEKKKRGKKGKKQKKEK